MAADEVAVQDGQKVKTVEIFVNTKPVRMSKGKATGLEIKEAAVSQAVNIRADFVLFQEHGQGQRRVIGDHDFVNIHEGEKFEAIPHDDNS